MWEMPSYPKEGDPANEGKDEVAQFEFIPWVLSQCSSVKEARKLLKNMVLTGTSFAPRFPAAQLHWIIADAKEAITVESVQEGLKVYDNPVGVLTNNPPFEQQMFQLNNYMYLSAAQPENTFAKKLDLKTYSRGIGSPWNAGRPFLLHPVLCGWHLPRCIPFQEALRKKVSASFSTSWAVWSRPEAAVR